MELVNDLEIAAHNAAYCARHSIAGIVTPFPAELVQDYREEKEKYPYSIIGAEFMNTLYFFADDAELIHEVYNKPIDRFDNGSFLLVPVAEQNDLSLCLYENKYLMSIVKERGTVCI